MRQRVRRVTVIAVLLSVVLFGAPISVLALVDHDTEVLWLIGVGAVVAIGAGILVANWQARRLTEPLVYVAASAEQLGAGQVRPRLSRSGIEEIDLVAEELERSADRIAGRLAAERQFASDASHQLRTPLTALSMRLEEIERLSDNEEVREEARISLEQIERLVATVSELLSRSHRESVPSALEVVHVADVVSQQREEWGPAFARAGRDLSIEVVPHIAVLASPGALSQVIATLLENSLVHGNGTTRLGVRSSGGNIAIEVADEGPGVDDELAPHIFERHVSADGGTGLGLAVARDLVTADGGRLELSHRRPAMFTIFLQSVPASLDPDEVIPPGAFSPSVTSHHPRP